MRAFDWRRLWLALAGLIGASGVALAAASAHLARGAEPDLDLAAHFMLFHAPALLAIAALTRWGARWMNVAAGLLAFGTICFAGGLALIVWVGRGFAPLVPIGGTALILGWLALAASAVTLRGPVP